MFSAGESTIEQVEISFACNARNFSNEANILNCRFETFSALGGNVCELRYLLNKLSSSCLPDLHTISRTERNTGVFLFLENNLQRTYAKK
jgi:hypothetical protein